MTTQIKVINNVEVIGKRTSGWNVEMFLGLKVTDFRSNTTKWAIRKTGAPSRYSFKCVIFYMRLFKKYQLI